MTVDLTINHKMQTMNQGQIVTIFEDKIIAVTESQALGTIVVCAGGVSLPVKETKAQVELLVTEAKNGTTNTSGGGNSE